MHVTHLDDDVIATRGVLGSAIPTRGVAKPRPCEWTRLAADLTNGIIQQPPSPTAEYFVRVIRLAALVDGLSPSAGALQMDIDGQRRDWMLGDGGPARLVVDEVTDAVKEIVDGRVVGSLDRDQLWSVRGFVLSQDVVPALSGDEFTPEGLIEAVTGAGYTWTIARVNPSSSV